MDVRDASAAPSPDHPDGMVGSNRLQVSVSARTLWLIAGIATLVVCVGVVLLKGILVFLLLFMGIVLAVRLRAARIRRRASGSLATRRTSPP